MFPTYIISYKSKLRKKNSESGYKRWVKVLLLQINEAKSIVGKL